MPKDVRINIRSTKNTDKQMRLLSIQLGLTHSQTIELALNELTKKNLASSLR